MIITSFIQIVPKYSRGGKFLGAIAKTISQSAPRVSKDGAYVVKVNLTIPDDAFKPSEINAAVDLKKMQPAGTAEQI